MCWIFFSTSDYFTAMYCSRKCLERDEPELHYALCGKTDQIDTFEFRMCNRLRKVFRESMPEWCNYLAKEMMPSVFKFDFSNCQDPFYSKNMMYAALGGEIKRDYSENRMKDVKLDLKARLTNMEDKLHACMMWTSKDFEAAVKSPSMEKLYSFEVGWTFHPLFLSFKSSCHPSLQVVEFTEEGVLALIVTYPVKAGDQLTLRHHRRNDWHVKEKAERQLFWKKSCGFYCECEACVNDWKSSAIQNYNLQPEYPQCVTGYEQAFKAYSENCKYINERYTKER
jgi:hypothetical protein